VVGCGLSHNPVPSLFLRITPNFFTQSTGCWMNYFLQHLWVKVALDGARKTFLIYPTPSCSCTRSQPLQLSVGSPEQQDQEGSGYPPSTPALQHYRRAPCYSLVRTAQDITIWLGCHGRCRGSCKLREELFITRHFFLIKFSQYDVWQWVEARRRERKNAATLRQLFEGFLRKSSAGLCFFLLTCRAIFILESDIIFRKYSC